MQLGKYDGKPVVMVDNALNWPFEAEAANRFWVSGIPDTKTNESSLCHLGQAVLGTSKPVRLSASYLVLYNASI